MATNKEEGEEILWSRDELEREQESSRNNLKRKLVEVISSDSELVTDSDIFNISQTVINNALEYKANGTNKKRSAKCPTCKKKYNSTEVSSHKCGPCNFTYGCNNECRLIHTGSVAVNKDQYIIPMLHFTPGTAGPTHTDIVFLTLVATTTNSPFSPEQSEPGMDCLWM